MVSDKSRVGRDLDEVETGKGRAVNLLSTFTSRFESVSASGDFVVSLIPFLSSFCEIGLAISAGSDIASSGLFSPCEVEGASKPSPKPVTPLLLVAIELPRLKPPVGCALHLLLTLSDRFIIALCTKPPSPFVGEGGRSLPIRLCAGDIAGGLEKDESLVVSALDESERCPEVACIGGPSPPLLIEEILGYLSPTAGAGLDILEASEDRSYSDAVSEAFSASDVDSLDNPGNLLLLTCEEVSDIVSS